MSDSIADIQRAADAWFERNRDRFADLEPTEHLKNSLRRVARARVMAERSAA